MNSTGRRAAALTALAAVTLLAGCVQPEPPPPTVTETVTVPPPSGPGEVVSGTVGDAVSLETPGPAEFSVRTVVLAPGDSTGWHYHPGYEMSVVRSGSLTLIREDDCEEVTLSAGDAVFIPDQLRHLARNDGDEPAEVVVTYVLAPDAQERFPENPACD